MNSNPTKPPSTDDVLGVFHVQAPPFPSPSLSLPLARRRGTDCGDMGWEGKENTGMGRPWEMKYCARARERRLFPAQGVGILLPFLPLLFEVVRIACFASRCYAMLDSCVVFFVGRLSLNLSRGGCVRVHSFTPLAFACLALHRAHPSRYGWSSCGACLSRYPIIGTLGMYLS